MTETPAALATHCDFLVYLTNVPSFHPGFIALLLALLKRGGEHPVQN